MDSATNRTMVKDKHEYGCKNGEFLLPIQKVLENEGELSGKELFEKARNEIDKVSLPNYPKESFAQALHCLLMEKIIQIEEYDVTLDPRRTKHAFKYEYFIYSLVKKDPIKILNLINNLFSDDEKKAYKSYQDLKKRYMERIHEIDSKKAIEWEHLKKNVIERNLRIDEMLQLEGVEEDLAIMYAHPEFIQFFSPHSRHIEDSKKYKKELPKIKDKYKDYNAYFLKSPDNERSVPESVQKKLSTPVMKDKNDNIFTLKDLNPQYDDFKYKKMYSADPSFNKKEYLQKSDFNEPIKRKNPEINNLFETIIYKAKISNSRRLAQQLATGLSKTTNADSILENLKDPNPF